jgi:hypothetical protein
MGYKGTVMKNIKPQAFLGYSIMLAALLGSCLNPISFKEEEGAAALDAAGRTLTNPLPVEVEVKIYRSSAAAGRNAASPRPDTRAAAGVQNGGIRNENLNTITQLIVVDENGAVINFFENVAPNEAPYEILIPSGGTPLKYGFLMLAGHKGSGGGAPTLLRAGFKSVKLPQEEMEFSIRITLWPLLVDTGFTSADAYIQGDKEKDPLTGGGAQELPAVKWTLNWGIKTVDMGANSGGSGLIQLWNARAAVPGNPSSLFFKARGIINNEKENTPPAVTEYLPGGSPPGNISVDVENSRVTLDIIGEQEKVPKINMTGSANFNLEYVPFSLAKTTDWAGFVSESQIIQNGLPVWIIRNGLNDLAQDGDTDFSLENGSNGNGAVRFTVTAAESDDLTQAFSFSTRSDGSEGLDGSLIDENSPEIEVKFSGQGSSGDVDLYYAVIAPDGDEYDYSAYKFLAAFTFNNNPQTPQMFLPGENRYSILNNEIYVILTQGGKVSKPCQLVSGSWVDAGEKGEMGGGS